MEAAQRELSQAEFAREMGVSRAAVSQWKAKDILRDDAFTKPGKKGKVIFHIAVEQVRVNRDLGQSLGNGIGTRTAAPDGATPAPAPAAEGTPTQLELPSDGRSESVPEPAADASVADQPKSNSLQDLLIAARLEEQLRKNRIGASEEALRQGMLMAADDVREQMTRVSGMMMQIFEGALTDFAAALASQFDVPQRDALHLLKNEFRNVRKTATMKQRALAEQTPKGVTTNVELNA